MPPMLGSATVKLKSIEIERFRAVRFCRFELHPEVTALVGDNASGKTLILDAIRLLLSPVVKILARKIKPSQRKTTEPERITFDNVYQVKYRDDQDVTSNHNLVWISGTELE